MIIVDRVSSVGLIRVSPGLKTMDSQPAALATWQSILTALAVVPAVFWPVKLHWQP